MPQDLSYLRFPSVRGDTVAFVADDDVWLAPSTDGNARRLTSDRAPASYPRLSPDGSLVAYTSRRDGIPEIYVVSTTGGEVLRLTYLSDRFTQTIGWTDDGRVLMITAAGEPFRSRTWAWAVAPEGGPGERLTYGPVTSVSRGPGGMVVLGVNQSSHRGAAWKRYRGGTAAALWIDRAGNGEFERYLADVRGQLEDPSFVGERISFVSDHEGVGNLYSALPDGSDLRRHSDHSDFYARAASSDGKAIVYQCAGELYRVDDFSRGSAPRRLEISLAGPRNGRDRQTLRGEDELGAHSTDYVGRASAVEVRGEVHWLTHSKGPASLVAGGSGVRARLPRSVGRGAATTILVTDAEGDDALEVVEVTGTRPESARRIGAGQIGRVLDLAASPDGKHAAVATHDGRVILVDLESGSLATLDRSADGDATGLCFSPDSKYLAWAHAGPLADAEAPLRHLKLAELGGEVVDLTPLRFEDFDPVFSLDGKYVAFLSARTFDPVYDRHVFDMSFAAAVRPYLIPLAAATPSPFDAELGGRARPDHRVPEAPGSGSDVPAVTIDLDGLTERIVPFPVAAGRYSHLRPARGGFLWLSEPLLGVLGEERASADTEPQRPRLMRFDLARATETELVAALDGYETSGDGRSVVVRDAKCLRVLPADRKLEPLMPGQERDPADLVEIDLTRLRIEVDPPVEWAQMYDEAARLMRDHFWVADMAGVDWAGMVERYRPWLDRIATRDDLSELLWEVQGELGSSHAYETPPERPLEGEHRLGLLGADVQRDEDGTWRVTRIESGESSVLAARSPLRAPGAAMHPGDAILAIDGRPVDYVFGPAASLVGAARKPVQLTVRDGSGGAARDVVVEPLDDERPLHYQAWVAGRRAAVHAATDGRVGYLHVPDMMGKGWADLHRDLRIEVGREGLVIDVRDNGGGHVSQLVLERLERTVHAWELGRHVSTSTYPLHAPRGPRVLVTNEQAGSDGDIVTAGFRQRQLGPVVGTRTWGGVIGIDARYKLVDRTTVTQPRYAFWFYGFGWGVENYGVDPDIEVALPPQDWAAGRDPQLDRAIELVLEALEREPAQVPPDRGTRPSRVPPPLPPRPGG
ncbi:MAG: S41 family peptidase [Acidimicrobiales bacterium]